jgi:tetratricopeptide (TPR) repeat protein
MGVTGVSRRRAVLAALTIALVVSGCAGSRQAPIDTNAREMKVLQARAAHERGMAHAREGQPSAALTALQEAVSLDPDTALYANSLGVVLLQLRQLDGALAWLGKALQLDPNYGDAQLNYAIVLAEARRWDDAVEGYRKALRMPTLTAPHVAHQNLGVALYNLKRYGQAEESLRFAISLDPQMLGAYYNLGLVLAAGNRREEAKAAFRKARDLGPDSPFGQAAGERLKALGEGG